MVNQEVQIVIPASDSKESLNEDSDSRNSSESSRSSNSNDVRVKNGIVLNKKKTSKLRAVGEEEWGTASETLVLDWALDCEKRAADHEMKKQSSSILHSLFGLPTILLPTALAALTPLIESQPFGVYIQVSGLIVVGCFGAVNAFYNFDKQSARHSEAAARFLELNTDVKYQLQKQRQFRISADEFIARIQTKYNHLIERAP